MFNRLFAKKKLSEEEKAQLRDKLIVDAGEFDKLVNQDGAWKLYVEKIKQRIIACRTYKLNTKLAMADDKTKRLVELLEYQADILEWAINYPAQFVADANKAVENAPR